MLIVEVDNIIMKVLMWYNLYVLKLYYLYILLIKKILCLVLWLFVEFLIDLYNFIEKFV